MIDWKHLATTDGYRSLKAAYIHDVQEASRQKRPIRGKSEFLRKFQWVISRAKHYAHHTGRPIEVILNEWEEKRSYWWLNYYQEGGQPKFHSNSKKPMGIKGIAKHYKTTYSHNPERAAKRMREFVNRDNKKKTKPRWDMLRKQRGY